MPEVQLEPEQPPAVVAAVRALVVPERAAPDPWWQAGLDQALAPAVPTTP